MGTYLDDVGFALTLTNLKPKFDALAEQIGNLDQLDTTAKTDLVAAINEIASSGSGISEITNIDNATDAGIYIYGTGGEKSILIVAASDQIKPVHQFRIYANGNLKHRYTDSDTMMGIMWGDWEDVSVSLRNNLTATISGQALDATQGRVLNNKIGDMNDLTTTAKNNLVSAINELAESGGGFADLGFVDIGTDGLPAIPYTGASRNGFYTFTCTVTGFLFSTNSGTGFWDVMIYKDNIYTRIYSEVPLPPPTWTIVGSSGIDMNDVYRVTGQLKNLKTTDKTNLVTAINEVNENAIITKTREGATSTDMGLISNLPIYTTDGGQIEYSGVFGDDKEVIPLINLTLKWGTNTYKTTLFQSRYQSSTSNLTGHIHQMLYWNDGETGIVPITRSIEVTSFGDTYWGVWTDCNGKEYSDLA